MLPLPFLLLLLIVCVGCIHVASVGLKLKSLKSQSLSDLVERVRLGDMSNVCRIARGESVTVGGKQIKATQVIDNLGGIEGLRHLHHNASTMLDIARFLILMSPQPCDLAQAVRHDAVRVRRMVTFLRWQARFRVLHGGVNFSSQILARSYVLVCVNTIRVGLQVLDGMPTKQEEFSKLLLRIELSRSSVENAT